MEVTNKTPEKLMSLWEHRHEIMNLMGKVSYLHMVKREDEIYERFWVRDAEPVLGLNNGFYIGAAVSGYYMAVGDAIRKKSELLRKRFPKTLAEKTEAELRGVGQMDAKPLDTFIVEVAEDENTAKCVCYSRGSYVDVTEFGPVSYWTWGMYAVDLIRENGAWKIWHLLYLEDVDYPCGMSWTKPAPVFPADPAFAEIADIRLPAPTVECCLRERYYPDRAFTGCIRLPEPYGTFADTFSYGANKEEWE